MSTKAAIILCSKKRPPVGRCVHTRRLRISARPTKQAMHVSDFRTHRTRLGKYESSLPASAVYASCSLPSLSSRHLAVVSVQDCCCRDPRRLLPHTPCSCARGCASPPDLDCAGCAGVHLHSSAQCNLSAGPRLGVCSNSTAASPSAPLSSSRSSRSAACLAAPCQHRAELGLGVHQKHILFRDCRWWQL